MPPTVRVGLELGRGARDDLGRAADDGAGARHAIALVGRGRCSGPGRSRLIGLFLDPANPKAPAVLAYAVPLLLVAAAFQTVDSLQAVASGLLRGVKDTRVPMLIALFSYWGGRAAGRLAARLRRRWGGIGIWWGLALGLAAAAMLLNGRFQMRDRLGLLGR